MLYVCSEVEVDGLLCNLIPAEVPTSVTVPLQQLLIQPQLQPQPGMAASTGPQQNLPDDTTHNDDDPTSRPQGENTNVNSADMLSLDSQIIEHDADNVFATPQHLRV